ncbi:protein kinase [Pseudoxanthomonas sp.]|uniref:protein kinase domain-containing protein n=1 Tax=Pseudoxanthomonas sp. TaxID=1871049 RepID=UPI00262BA336|nr:protein kinase [Pseudoxanthomonas sp.]WDS37800.1 MAG: protein kinase [Pseudoxanthomonas sp.]
MSEEPISVADLVNALGHGHMDLQHVLAALTARGMLPRREIDEGMQTVWRLREEQMLDEISVTTLLDRLRAASYEPVEPVDDDATVVAPSVRGASAPSMPADQEDDVTRVAPAMTAAGDPRASTGTGSGTGTEGVSEWKAVAKVAVVRSVGAGDLLKGRFQLERELGRGGMGVVWLARDERKIEARDRDPFVAVKVLSDEFRRHPDSLVALQREARRSQQLAHDNIVRVYDFDKDGAIVYMTMEYVDGSDLKTLIREQAFNGLSLAKAWPLIEGVSRALARAHAAGIVHSDFKPGNVMVTRDGVPKVFDFGIARAGKHAGDAEGEQTVFDASTLGALTPAYASLEMIRGEQPGPRDDIYALGCVCYELLTGKHPFGKVSAEVALREGRTPPLVPGLTRRQQRTLAQSVAFEAKGRLADVQSLLDGMRQVPLRERAMPLAAAGGGALLVIGGAVWAGMGWFHQRNLAAMIAAFDPSDPKHYRDEAAAQDALDGLSSSDRRDVLADHAQTVIGFLMARLDALWNPAQGHFEYRRAQDVFALRDRLRLYSPELDARKLRVEQERDRELNRLDSQVEQRIAAGALFPDQHDNVLDSLRIVGEIDPDSALLHNPQLEAAYDAAVQSSLQAGNLGAATQQLSVAQQRFPDSLPLQLRQSQLVEQRALAEAVTARAPAQDARAARTQLQQLLDKPDFTVQWQQQVASALDALKASGQPVDPAELQALASGIVGLISSRTAPADLARAQALAAFGLAEVPADAALQAQQQRLQQAGQSLDQLLARDRASAEIAARTESLRRAAAAGDLEKARQAYARLVALQPDGEFVKGAGADLLAQAHVAAADGKAASGDYAGAAAIMRDAISLLPGRKALVAAQERDTLVADILANARAPAEQRRQQLLTRLQVAWRDDARGMGALESQMKAGGQLPQGSLEALLQAQAGSAESRDQVAPDAASGRPAARTPAGKRPERGSAGATASTAAGTAATATVNEDDLPLPPVPDGPDPCGQAGLAGSAKACFDQLGDGQRGPMLVVVPGMGGGKRYALSRGEITVDDFNAYCKASGRCNVRSLADPSLGRLPVTNVSLGQARAYARWLIRTTDGWRYRLPTDAEWLYAAQAAQDWKQAPDSNCVPPTASTGSDAPVSIRGRQPNPWGLVNMSGNVWEWTVDGNKTKVRGGSFASFWSDCSVASVRQDGGNTQPDVGFRVLRELK